MDFHPLYFWCYINLSHFKIYCSQSPCAHTGTDRKTSLFYTFLAVYYINTGRQRVPNVHLAYILTEKETHN